jgi:hypothetical protein
LFQGSNCNRQIPAKAYEYIRAGAPIVSICDPAGDTAQLLAGVPGCLAADFGNVQQIAAAIMSFLREPRSAVAEHVDRSVANRYERKTLTGELASLLDDLN